MGDFVLKLSDELRFINENEENSDYLNESMSSPQSKRFKAIDDRERKRLLDGLTSENTKRGTKRAIIDYRLRMDG